MCYTKISVIIPTYNEAEIIKNTIETVQLYLKNNCTEYELIIADDGSTDDTKSIVRSIENASLQLVDLCPHMGKGYAVRSGVKKSEGDVIVYTDADLAYGTEPIKELVQKLENGGYDIAVGSRKLHSDGYENYPPIRLLASRFFGLLTGMLAGFDYDTQCGIKAFTAKAAKDIFSRCRTDGFAFDFEVIMYAVHLSYSIVQLPVKIINHRQSKVRVLRDSIRMFTDIICIRRTVIKSIKGEVLCDQK